MLGKVFWIGALEAIGEVARWKADAVLHRLERKQFVQRARRSSVAGEAEYAFRHALLRDVAYGQIPRSARAEKHRRAAEWLESLGRAEDHAELLADHYVNALEYARASGHARADLAERARLALRDAGDRTSALAAYPAAVRFYAGALELWPSEADDRAALLLRLGRARFNADSTGAEELDAALEAFGAAGDYEGAAEAVLARRQVFWYGGDRGRSDAALDDALDLVRERPDSPAKAEVLVARASAHAVAGEHADAIRIAREALALVERLGLDALRARLLNSVGMSRVYLGDPEGVHDVEHAVAIARASSASVHLHSAWNNLAVVQLFLGRLADAVQTYETLLDSVERFGRDTDRRWVRGCMAATRASEGRWDEAVAVADAFIADVESGSPHYLETSCRVVRASIRLARGDVAGAASDAERALETAREAKDVQVVAPALHACAAVALAAGRRADADALATEVLALGQKLVPGLVSEFGVGTVQFAWLVRELGREAELLAVLSSAPPVPWVVAAQAVLRGEFDRAAAVLAEIGSRPTEAYTRLRAAEELARAGRTQEAAGELGPALDFYCAVGATGFIREAEALGVAAGRRAS